MLLVQSLAFTSFPWLTMGAFSPGATVTLHRHRLSNTSCVILKTLADRYPVGAGSFQHGHLRWIVPFRAVLYRDS